MTSITRRVLCAAAFAAGAMTLWPYIAGRITGTGDLLRMLVAGIVLAASACGWHRHGPWLPSRLASLYVFGLAAGTLGALW